MKVCCQICQFASNIGCHDKRPLRDGKVKCQVIKHYYSPTNPEIYVMISS